MAQGLVKKSKPTSGTAKRYVLDNQTTKQAFERKTPLMSLSSPSTTNARTQLGPRKIAPKKASLIKQQKLNKVQSISVSVSVSISTWQFSLISTPGSPEQSWTMC